MIANKHLMAIALGACLLGLSSLSSQKNPVERALKGNLDGTGVFTVDGGGNIVSYEGVGEGHLTHLGRFTTHADGLPDQSGVLVLEGVFKAANGDEVCWEMSDPVVGVITGGTGRFTGATGGFITVEPEIVWIDPVTIAISHQIEGTITY